MPVPRSHLVEDDLYAEEAGVYAERVGAIANLA